MRLDGAILPRLGVRLLSRSCCGAGEPEAPAPDLPATHAAVDSNDAGSGLLERLRSAAEPIDGLLLASAH